VNNSGGAGGYTYSWTNGGSTQTISGLVYGGYTVTVTDANSCTKTTSATLTQPTNISISVSKTNVSCNTGNDGNATATPSGGTVAVAYTYNWNTTPAQTTAIATGLTAGSYTVTVTDDNSCTQTNFVTITQPTALTVSTSNTNILCHGNANGTTTATPSGGTTPYTYAWSSGHLIQTAFGLNGGTYTVTVTDANSCTKTATATVSEPAALALTTSKVDILCKNDGNGQVTANPTGGTVALNYGYSWTGGQTTKTAVGLNGGTYTVTVTDDNSCTITGTATVSEPTLLTATTSKTNVSCNTGNSGNATVTPSGGTVAVAYQYLWSVNASSQTTATANNLIANTYTVTITDDNSCTLTKTVTITEPTALTVSIVPVNNNCYGDNNGTATATPSGGTGAYSYAWSNSSSMQVAINLIAGTYTLTVTDVNSCTVTQTTTITEPPQIIINSSSVDASICGKDDGSITITATGTATLTYSINGIGGPFINNGGSFTGLFEGNYSIAVKDGNNCIEPGITEVISSGGAPAAPVAGTNATYCSGDALANMTVTAGAGGLLTWYSDLALTDVIGTGTTKAPSNTVGTTTYYVTETTGGCESPSSSVAITIIAPPTANAGSNAVICETSNYVFAPAYASATNYSSLNWTTSGDGSFTGGTTLTPTYTPGANDISSGLVTLTLNALGNAPCAQNTNSMDLVIKKAPIVNAGIDDDLCGGQNYVFAVGQVTASNYSSLLWETSGTGSFVGATTLNPTYVPSAADILSGSVTLNLLALANSPCSDQSNFMDLTIATPVTVNAGSDDIICEGGNYVFAAGYADATNYSTINWSTSGDGSFTGGTTLTPTYNPGANDISSGQVTLTLTANGVAPCTNINDNMKLTISKLPIVDAGLPGSVCAGLSYAVSGASASNFNTVLWTTSGGGSFVNATTLTPTYTPDATDISNGSVLLTLTAYGNSPCGDVSKNVNLTINQGITTTFNITDVLCNGGNDGDITANPSGGVAPYTYEWDVVPTQTTQTATGLTAGFYRITVTDNNGCKGVNDGIEVDEPDSKLTIATTASKAKCNLSDGSVSVGLDGGTLPYSVLWNPGAITSTGNILIENLSAGSYTVQVTDAHNCFKSQIVDVLNENGGTPSIVTLNNNMCYGESNGDVKIAMTGGTRPFTYEWHPSGGSDSLATGLTAGSYILEITEFNGCKSTQSIDITEPPLLRIIQENTTNITCNALNNGIIEIFVEGGETPYEYSITGSSGTFSNSNTFSNLTPGTYDIYVKDANGCNVTGSTVQITEPTAITASVASTNVTCNGLRNGTITVTASGGTGSLVYSHDNGLNFRTSNMFGALLPNNYNVVIRDNSGCTVSGGIVAITEPTVLTATTSKTDVACYGAATGISNVVPAGGTSPFTYLWSNATSNQNATGLTAGNYTVTVTDNQGCTLSKNYSLTQQSQMSIIIQTNPATCNVNNGKIFTDVVGGVPLYGFNWSTTPTQSNPNLTGLAFGTYTVTVTDGNNCTLTSSATVQNVSSLNIAIDDIKDVTCFGGNDGEITASVTGGSTPYTILWNTNPTQTALKATNLTARSYEINVIDGDNCGLAVSATVAEPTEITENNATLTSIVCYGDATGQIDVDITGGTLTSPDYTYLWSTSIPQTTSIATGLTAGTYSVTVTDDNSCTESFSYTVTQVPAIQISYSQTDVLCYNYNTGTALVQPTGGSTDFNYVWSPNVSTDSIATGLTAGSYTVTVSDVNGCTNTEVQIITITQPATPVQAVIVNNPINVCYGTNTGLAEVSASGGTPNYTYSWNSNPIQTDPIATGLYAGNYIVIVTDLNGCTTTALANVIQASNPLSGSIFATTVNPCFGYSNGALTVSPSGGYNTAYSYNWSTNPIQTTQTATGLTSGIYTVTIYDNNNCEFSVSYNLVDPSGITVSNVDIQDAICSGNNGTAEISASGGANIFGYLWSDSNHQNTPEATGLYSGAYTVTVTDASNCTTTHTLTVGDTDDNESASFIAEPYEGQAPIEIYFNNTSNNAQQYLWNFGFNNDTSTMENPSYKYEQEGTFNVRLVIVSPNGCIDSVSHIIVIQQPTTFEIPNVFTPNYDGSNDVFSVKSTGLESLNGQIYNRWGHLIYEWDGINGGWDGRTIAGSESPAGTYYYIISIKGIDNKTYEETGFVVLER